MKFYTKKKRSAYSIPNFSEKVFDLFKRTSTSTNLKNCTWKQLGK
jgi:hypothetical protein